MKLTQSESSLCSLLFTLFAVWTMPLLGEEPPCVSGIYPHLAMFNNESECGTGAVVPWADRLWAITYGPHLPHGSSDKLYEITPELEQIVRQESVGGTHANRMIHKESKQLVIGPYLIDENRNVRVVSPKIMPGRLTANARHLTAPANKIYFTTMEEGLYEVDVHTLAVKNFIKDGNPIKKGYTDETDLSTVSSKLPGYHGKGTYSGQGRVVYANNGDRDPRVMTDPTVDSGALGGWNGSGDWQLIRRNQFTEVTGPGGIFGNDHPGTDPIWSIGWDHRSLILMLLDEGKWTAYRLPKASHTYDGAHGWHTEWPRIREIGEGNDLLMTMHGAFWKFPKTFSSKNSSGIEMRSTYLKVIGDFCRWNDRIVFGCDDSAKAEFTNKRKIKGNLAGPGQSQSNLWFVDPARLDRLGPRLGRGAVWMGEDVPAGRYSEPYWIGGDNFAHKTLYLKHEGTESAEITVEIDEKGTGEWKDAEAIMTPNFTSMQSNYRGVWIRFKPTKDLKNATVMFQYRDADKRSTTPAAKFDGLAKLDDAKVNGGIMLVRGGGFKTLRCVMRDENGSLGVYDLDGALKLKKVDDPNGEKFTSEKAAIPKNAIMVDDASVLVVDEKGRWRLPKGDIKRDENGPLGDERICREVATERDLFHAHGTFYELPAENSGGVQKIRPIASHPYRIKDYASFRGMIVLSGLSIDASADNPHVVQSDDGKAALWCGAIDDLWELGKSRGVGGPWKNSTVNASEPSDPYLMAGYDKKRLQLSHDNKDVVEFHIELDVCGNGDWTRWQNVTIEPGKIFETEISLDAYWIRFVSTQSCKANATLIYE